MGKESRNNYAPKILDDWYVACESSALKKGPVSLTIFDQPFVVFRGENGEVGALLDRCPHRNVPLSLGRVQGNHLECGYHGWQFDTAGSCKVIPGLCGEATNKRVEAFPVREQDGFVWIYPTESSTPPSRQPFRFPFLDDARYTTVRHTIDLPGTLHSTAENALDVPHTAFLHKGLFRTDGKRNEIRVVVKRWDDRAEAEYIGEPRPEGVLGKMISPSGGTVTHFDRFILPCVAQVEYKLGEENHVMATTALTPLSEYNTRMFAAVTFRTRLPGTVAGRVLKPLALRILNQDARMLGHQTKRVHSFGGEQYSSTEIDLLGPSILKLMRQAEQGKRAQGTEPTVRELKMLV